MSERKRFISLYILMYMAFSFGLTQFTPYLSKIGYDEFERGILLSSYAVTTIFLQMIIGFYADKFQTIKRFVFLLLLFYLISTCCFYFISTPLFLLHLLLLAISGSLINTITGLSDTWILKGSEEVRVNFSFIKAFGSIGWASGSLLLSILIGTSGYTGLSLGIFGLVVASMLVVFFLKDIEKIVTKHTEKVQLKDFKSVILNQNYRWLIIILFLLYSAIIANNITVVDKMITLGATDLQIGYKWSIQSLFEIPAYLFGARLFNKWSNFTLLKITACVLSLQFILFALSGSSWVIIGLSALQFFTTPLLMISSKQLIFSMTDERMQSTGQLFALSIFTGLSSLVVPVLAGYVTKAFNVDITLFIVGIVPIIALWMTAKLQLMTIKKSELA